ncbi:polysaccharide deacetylase family protein [Deinococcus koreensis]|uniref:Polysaccharide deacetylase family protein n=1 Tax=Deinococcus koreensis TaxID=2054903 RepID=A0A2K3UWD7_9DEIO|nr:polysaccharide deacetylase family protein [Deinococcus koreensis]PNY80847.1 polysaccharide deacetylase family protein [Deinococcus koreensis]
MRAPLRPLLLALAVLGACGLAQTSAAQPVQVAPGQLPPGAVQPVAPGTRPAPAPPTLTLTPAIPEVRSVQYLGNGFIEVAHAVLTVEPAQRGRLRPLVQEVARRVLAARPELSEVDLSVYDRGAYASFGGPLPVLTASVPRRRLDDFTAWAGGTGAYERVWVNPGTMSATRAPDQVRETGPRPAAGRESALEARARNQGGVLDGLLYRGRFRSLQVAALTFDDAPHPLYEPLLLDLLRRSGVKATFFVIGRNAAAYPFFIHDLAAQGHEIGNHTYHHVRLPPLTPAEVTQELQLTNRTLQALTGQPVRYFRPPGGDYTPQTLDAARALGLTTVFWTDDPADFANPGDAVVESRLTSRLRPGGIVLLHDNAPEMLDVLQGFLRVARQRGYTLTTLGGLPK